jgi:DNA-binding Lrp family transcriptional regulator
MGCFMKIDNFDRKILAELQKSSKLTNVELASRV